MPSHDLSVSEPDPRLADRYYVWTEKEFNAEAWRRKMRARQLLMSLLTRKQRWWLNNRGIIPVVSNLGERWRILTHGVVANCLREADGVGYCAMLRQSAPRYFYMRTEYGDRVEMCFQMPYADQWIGQMLWLQHDQKRFMNIAHPYRNWVGHTTYPGDKNEKIITAW